MRFVLRAHTEIIVIKMRCCVNHFPSRNNLCKDARPAKENKDCPTFLCNVFLMQCDFFFLLFSLIQVNIIIYADRQDRTITVSAEESVYER